ncbi:MAG: DUF1361 domain-containing protein [Longicatena sp.]
MDNKPKVKIVSIIILFILYTLGSLLVFENTGVYIHRAMIWNLFLALIPMLFCYLFLGSEKGIFKILFFIAWFVMFPNVPYLITDFIHITPLAFYTLTIEGTLYIRDIWVWIELLHIAIGVIFGLLVGYQSLFLIHHKFIKTGNSFKAWSMVIIVSLLSGYGVFLGRFLRLNSWDITHPQALMNNIMSNFNFFTLQFTVIFGAFVFFTYSLYYGIQNKK